MKTISALTLLAFLTAPAAQAQRCEFSKDLSENVELGAAKRVSVAAGAGELIVKGEAGRSAVNAVGRACASSQELLDQMQLETRGEDDSVSLRTVMPDMSGSVFGRRYAYIDLTVLIPQGATVSVEDSSGDLHVSGVHSATVADSSGDQEIHDIAGDLDVTDSSGDIEIERVGGNLQLKDSSGDVEVRDVRGDVTVTVDSSGDLEIERVAGSVHILNDSSGEIEISEVRQNVRIDVDSSGGIRVDQIGGDFTVSADGSGGVSHKRVSGRVSVPEED